MPDIVLYDKNGQPVIYEGVDSLSTDTPVAEEIAKFTYGDLLDGVQVEPYLKNGNQTITVPEGFLVREATILKPESLKPENIKKYETVAGVEGSFIGNPEENEVELDMENGDQIIEPTSEDALLSKVTVRKPETLNPKNIVKDVVIGGVKGTHEGIKLNNLDVILPITEITVPENTNGMVPIMNPIGLKPGQIYLAMWNNTGYVCTAQEATFQGLPVVALGNSVAWGGDNTGEPFAVGEFPAEVVSQTGGVYGGIIPLDGSTTFTAGCYFIGSDGYILDGFSVDLDFSSGENQKVTVPDGYLLKEATIVKPESLDPSNVKEGVNIGGIVGALVNKETAILLGTLSGEYVNTEITKTTGVFSVAFKNVSVLKLPNCTSVNANAFSGCSKLTSITISPINTLGAYAFQGCYKLSSVNFPYIYTIGNYAFQSCSALSVALLEGAETIGQYAFQGCSNLVSFNSPNVATIAYAAFSGCNKLKEANFPTCLQIQSQAFQACYSLSTINFPIATSIGYFAFSNCSRLIEANFPKVTDLAYQTFCYCYGLTTANFPLAKWVSNSTFYQCSNLTNINFPVASVVGYNAFYACSKLTSAIFPSAKLVYSSAFYGCSSLSIAEFNALTNIYSSAFYGCNKLMDLYLMGSSRATLQNAAVFYGTPMSLSTYTGTFGSIYVPTSLVTSYKTAAYWSVYSARIVSGDGVFAEEITSGMFEFGESKDYSFDITRRGDAKNYNVTATVTSSDDAVLTVSNVVATDSLLTFTLTAQQLNGTADITITISCGTYSMTSSANFKILEFAPEYSVVSVTGASYGFALNSSGYYESQNKGKHGSAAVCKIVFDTKGVYTFALDCINYAEGSYDYGIVSQLDKTLGLTNASDGNDGTTNVKVNFNNKNSANIYKVNYGAVSAGEHFIYVKFRKDGSGAGGNDSLQFKVVMDPV